MSPRPQSAGAGWPGELTPRLGEILDSLAEAVTIRDRDGRIAFANKAAVASMGFGSREELLERQSDGIIADYLVQDETGSPLTMDDVPSIRIMRGLEAPPLVMRTVHRETGEVSWRQLKATPLRDAGGELSAVVTVIEDITAVKTAEVRMRVLAESGRVLASSLDYAQTLENVAAAAVPDLADWCAVDLVDEQLHRETVAVAHQDPAKVALARRARDYEDDELTPEHAMARVVRTGASELFPVVTTEMLALGARSDEHHALLRELGLHSVVLVPLRVAARVIGVMTLVTAESRRTLSTDDVELAEQLGRRAAVAVENARLHTTLSGIASTLQRSLLPDALPEVPGWNIASLYRPADSGQRVDVGGDFYDVFASDAGWFAIIGDVTGKGVVAAALTSLLRHGAQFASRHASQPAAILAELDAALRSRRDESLSSALCLRLHIGQIVLSSAGHPLALIRRADGQVEEAPEPGPLLGAFADARWSEQALAVAPGELVLLYTDGVTEMAGSEDRFGTERLTRIVERHGAGGPTALLAALESELNEFGTGAADDDVAALALAPA